MASEGNRELATVDTEDEQLDVLLGELARIEGQQTKLRDAVTHSQAIVVHPRREAYESESDVDTPLGKPPSPMKIVASAGLVGFNVAQDLLTLDFSTPEEAPDEFRAVPFNSQKSVEVKPGLSGSFGVMDPMSKELHMYLKRLEEQQRHVLEIIANKRAMYGSARLSGSRAGLSSTRERTSSNLAPAMGAMPPLRDSSMLGESTKKVSFPRNMGIQPQVSRKAPLQAQRSLEERRAAPAVPVPDSINDDADVGPGTSSAMDIHRALPPIRTRVQDEDAAALSSIEERRDRAKQYAGKVGGPKPAPAKSKKKDPPQPPVVIPDTFGGRQRDATGETLPSHMTMRGTLLWGFFVFSFGFYLFCRTTTISATNNAASLFVYQIIFLLAECCFFLSGVAFSISQVRELSSPPEVKTPEGTVDGTAEPAPPTQGVPSIPPAPEQELPPPTEGAPAAEISPEQQSPPNPKYHVQVLVYAGSKNASRMEEALVAAHAMDVPEGCTRVVYLVDPVRDQGKMDVVIKLALDGIVYMPASDSDIRPGADLGKAATLNRVLRKLYPKDLVVKETELVMVLNDDQIIDKGFLTVMVPYLKRKGVRLVSSQPGFENISASADVFNQLEEHYYKSTVLGYEAFGYVACASTGFLVRADALQQVGWFPTYSQDIGLALGIEFKHQRLLGIYHNGVLLRGLAPTTTAGVYHARSYAAQGCFQALFCPRPASQGSVDMRYRVMYHSRAWSQILWGWLFPLFVLVPIIRVFFNYFPFIPNKWFGLGFPLYYLIATPLLYHGKGCSSFNLVSWWNWTISSHNLSFTFFLDFWRAVFRDYDAHSLKKSQRQVVEREGKEPADTVVNITATPADGATTKMAPLPRSHDRPNAFREFPFDAAVGFGISLATVAVGCWLLFSTKGVLDASRAPALNVHSLRSNLSLILSILWAAVHAMIFSIPMYYSSIAVNAAATYDIQRRPANSATGSMSSGLTVWSSICFVFSVLFALLAVIACLWLGRGFDTIHTDMDGLRSAMYPTALASSLRFYAAQRSGPLVDNPISWRGNSGLNDTPTGGYYVGTNNLKLTLPIAIAATKLAWGMIASPQAFKTANASNQAKAELKWAADYLIACQTGAAEYVAMVGNVETELSYWARPEDMTWKRPTHKVTSRRPGSDIVANAAAALAAVSVAYQPYDYAYSKLALSNARNLYAFARDNQGLSTVALPDLAKVYNASGYTDDLMYAAAWLHRATQEPTYLSDAKQFYQQFQSQSNTSSQNLLVNWDNQYWLALMLMWEATGEAGLQSQLDSFLQNYMGGGNGVAITPKGLSWTGQNGPLPNAANAAHLALMYGNALEGGDHDYEALQYRCWARSQLDYILGSTGRSFVVGIGSQPPTHIPSPAASCPSSMQPCANPISSSPAFLSTGPNPHILRGALVSGPTARDRFTDGRSFQDTVIGLDYNAGFTAALAMVAGRHDWMKCEEKNGMFAELGVHLPTPAF